MEGKNQKMKYNDYEVGDFVTDELFVRWVKHADAESDFFWTKWLEENPEKSEKIQRARDIIQSFKYQNEYAPTQEEFIEVLENIHTRTKGNERISKSRKFVVPTQKIAAGISILLISMFLMYVYKDFNNNVNNVAEVYKKEIKYIIKDTQRGQKLSLKLPDGTAVKLNAESELKIPETFSDAEERIVYLEGEAFFDVAEDSTRPFKIFSGDLVTTVLGTSFNIRSYPFENSESIAVLTGKVKVETLETINSLESSMLLANDFVSYDKLKQERLLKRNIDVVKEVSWTKGILIYENTNLKKILDELGRWYDVEFIVDEKVNTSMKYSGTFDNKSLENILSGLSFTSNGFSFKIEGKKVIITE